MENSRTITINGEEYIRKEIHESAVQGYKKEIDILKKGFSFFTPFIEDDIQTIINYANKGSDYWDMKDWKNELLSCKDLKILLRKSRADYEAQIEQLNRELTGTKASLALSKKENYQKQAQLLSKNMIKSLENLKEILNLIDFSEIKSGDKVD